MQPESLPGEDSFELHSVDLELEAVEKQIRDLQAQRKDAACSGFVHSGTGVPHSLDESSGRRKPSPGRGPLPIRRHLSSRSRPRTALLPFVPAILKKNIGAVVLHAGTNDIRLRQTEILKKDFRSLVELVRTTLSTTRIIVSGPLPTFQRGIE
ncbi:hypothetical protein QTP70_033975, partial [Hemibagrus guttatus]